MSALSARSRFRAGLLLLSSMTAPALFAGTIIAPTATLPPPTAVYVLGNTCITVVCLEKITISNFVLTKASISGSDELTTSDLTLNADVFTNPPVGPGMFINPIVMAGTVDITYFGRKTLIAQGTFPAEITSLDLSGTFNGLVGPNPHSVDAQLNPAQTSDGVTSVNEIGRSKFLIGSFFDVFAELSIDGGPFVPGPPRVLDLGTPEPSSASLILGGCLMGGALLTRRRLRKRA
ncbi:MAG TPA: PEP-CTERM sorting domain-containing protein [Bryobacteraceae bacterium]|nr:PEP-CTERM sorting domain-containing protein [Bryobacteraceae bacterium]